MFERIKQIIIKEFIHTFRDPKMKLLVFIPPLIQMFIFGYAATTDIKNISLAVTDYSRTMESRKLIEQFTTSGYFNLAYYCEDDKELFTLLEKNKVQAAINIPPEFASDLQKTGGAKLQLLVDGTESMTAYIVLNYASRIINTYASSLTALPRGIPVIKLEDRFWYNPELESRNFFIPGVIAMIVTVIVINLTSIAIVKEREMGTMEQILVTPIKPIDFILGKTVPFGIIGMFEVIFITAVGVLWFKIPLKGSIVLLLFSSFIYILSALAIGLLISTLCKTLQQAMMGSFFFLLPAILLSGFIFPIKYMPYGFQLLTYLNPMRYYMYIIRGIFLRGNGLDILYIQLIPMAILSLFTLALSILRFRKKMD